MTRVNSVKEGTVIFDKGTNTPYRIEYTHQSKTGKHGHLKILLDGRSVFSDHAKYRQMYPSGAVVDVIPLSTTAMVDTKYTLVHLPEDGTAGYAEIREENGDIWEFPLENTPSRTIDMLRDAWRDRAAATVTVDVRSFAGMDAIVDVHCG